jgi:hypothetical protein
MHQYLTDIVTFYVSSSKSDIKLLITLKKQLIQVHVAEK